MFPDFQFFLVLVVWINAGLQRCGKSCRLRWINYLRPDLKRGMFSQEEEDLIVSLHEGLGNRFDIFLFSFFSATSCSDQLTRKLKLNKGKHSQSLEILLQALKWVAEKLESLFFISKWVSRKLGVRFLFGNFEMGI